MFKGRNFKILLTAFLLVPLALAGCGTSKQEQAKASKPIASTPAVSQQKVAALGESEKSEEPTHYVRMDIQNLGSFVIELAPDAAPKTVAQFQKLVGEGFYDGLTFHRAVPDFVIQGGDPKGDGTGGASETIPGEFLNNGVFNPVKHKRGAVSMARSQDPNSASSQFFIVLDSRAAASLNDKYAGFGQVIYGMQVADQIAHLPSTNEQIQNKPVIEHAYFITQKAADEARALETQAESQEKAEKPRSSQ